MLHKLKEKERDYIHECVKYFYRMNEKILQTHLYNRGHYRLQLPVMGQLVSEEHVAEKTKRVNFRKRGSNVTLGKFQLINWQYDK